MLREIKATIACRLRLPDAMSTSTSDEFSPQMLEQIAERLRPACPDIPEAEFQGLVREVARVRPKSTTDRFANFPRRPEAPSPAHSA